MKYYLLDHDITEKVVGPYPQSTGMTNFYSYKEEDSVWNIDYDTMIAPNLDAIKLAKGAKLTDMLSVVVINDMIGRIVSEDFKELLERFRLPAHHFFEARVVDYENRQVSEKKYFLFRLREHQNQYINFDKSEFYIHRRGIGEIATFDAVKPEDLEGTSEELGLGIGQSIRPRFISLFSEVCFDIFSFRHFSGLYVSERLKTAIEMAGLTGIQFESADFILQNEVNDQARVIN